MNSSGQKSEAHEKFRRIRFANKVRVAGDAFTLTWVFEEINFPEKEKALEDLKPFLFRDIETELFRTLNGVKLKVGQPNVDYRVDRKSLELKDGSCILTVTVHGIVTNDRTYGAKRASTSSSGGELWVSSIDRFVEKARTRVIGTLSKSTELRDVYFACTWLPGQGVLISGGGIGDEQAYDYQEASTDEAKARAKHERDKAYLRELEEEMWGRQGEERSIRSSRRGDMKLALVYSSLLVGLLAFSPLLNLPDNIGFRLLFAVPEFVLVILVLFYCWRAIQLWRQQREVGNEIQELSDRIEVARLPEGMGKESYKLFKLNGHELKRYYDQALGQRGWVFALGVICILAGFASIGTAFALIQNPDFEDYTVVVAVLGGVGAILADFIAVIYLRMFSEIVKSAGEFHLRLVGTHHLHFANVLAGRIHENVPLANETLAKMAVSLAKELSEERAKDTSMVPKAPERASDDMH